MNRNFDIFSATLRLTNEGIKQAAKNITIENLIKIGEKAFKMNLQETEETKFIQQEIMSHIYGSALQ